LRSILLPDLFSKRAIVERSAAHLSLSKSAGFHRARNHMPRCLLIFVEVECFDRYKNVYTESSYMFNDILDITQRTDLWMG